MNMDAAPAYIVKICGITNAPDAITAIEAGANAIGFNFYEKSPRAITPAVAREIAALAPVNVLRVGVFVNTPLEQLLAVVRDVPLDIVQLHGEHAAVSSCRTWRALAAGFAVPEREPIPEAYLLDSYSEAYGGSGKSFDWTLARRHAGRVILAGGLTAENVAEAVAMVRPWGVDACSRLEMSPGRKDARRVQEFVRAAIGALQAREARIG